MFINQPMRKFMYIKTCPWLVIYSKHTVNILLAAECQLPAPVWVYHMLQTPGSVVPGSIGLKHRNKNRNGIFNNDKNGRIFFSILEIFHLSTSNVLLIFDFSLKLLKCHNFINLPSYSLRPTNIISIEIFGRLKKIILQKYCKRLIKNLH